MSEVAEKRPVGRPTEYQEKYCQEVIALGKLGKSLEQMAMTMDISYRTLCRWRDAYEEFRHALEDAHALSQAYWEELAQAHVIEHKDGEKLNTGLWSRSMAARFPKNYSDRVKQEITGAEGAPLLSGIEVKFVKPNE